MQRKEVGFLEIQKNNSKWIKDLNRRPKTMKLRRKCRGRFIYKTEWEDGFLIISPKEQQTKVKYTSGSHSKAKTSVYQRRGTVTGTLKNMRREEEELGRRGGAAAEEEKRRSFGLRAYHLPFACLSPVHHLPYTYPSPNAGDSPPDRPTTDSKLIANRQ